MSAMSQLPGVWVKVCRLAMLAVMIACSLRFGGSARTTAGDFALIVVLELAIPALLRSPLDVAHLHGQALLQWSTALGTAAAILAIFAHHRVRRR